MRVLRVLRVLGVLGVLTVLLGAGGLIAHDRISTKVTWQREIAPIVQARCASCHSPGGPAPMSLTTYEEARPWAVAIKEEVLTRRMPKWPIVRGYGDFVNDRSLSPFEISLIASWVDGGAPRSLPTAVSVPPATIVGDAERRVLPSKTRAVTLPCSTRTLPAGRLAALRPTLRKGEELRLILTHPDGRQEPLMWLKGFDPAFADTYWLRTPATVMRGTHLTRPNQVPAACTIELRYTQ